MGLEHLLLTITFKVEQQRELNPHSLLPAVESQALGNACPVEGYHLPCPDILFEPGILHEADGNMIRLISNVNRLSSHVKAAYGLLYHISGRQVPLGNSRYADPRSKGVIDEHPSTS